MKKFLCLCFLFIALAVNAQVWTGSVSSDVSTGQNWNTNSAPNTGSSIMFQSSGNTVVFFNWPTATTGVNGITFNGGSSNYTFNGSNSTDLEVGDINNNQSGSTQTFNIGLNFRNNSSVRTNGNVIFNNDINSNGTGKVNFDGSGEIIFGSNAVVGSNVELTLMNGVDLDLGGTSQSFAKLNVTGHSIIDFAGGASINIDWLNIQDGGSLTILNWTIDSYFAVANQPTIPVVNRVIFDGFSSPSWNSGTTHIGPPIVPEPSTYGAFCLGGLLAFTFYRRKR